MLKASHLAACNQCTPGMKLKARLHSHTHNIQAARSWRTRRSCPPIAVEGKPLKRNTLPGPLSRTITTIPAEPHHSPNNRHNAPANTMKHRTTTTTQSNPQLKLTCHGPVHLPPLTAINRSQQIRGRVHNNTILPKSSTATLPQPHCLHR